MRRITLALALVGAVTAAGCSGGATSTSGGNEGVAENTFKVTIQNGQDGNTTLAITGGYVKSTPAGIDCGDAGHGACEFEFASGTPVTLTAYPSAGFNFYGFAGDCHTTAACAFTGHYADLYVLAQFLPAGTLPVGHAQWNPAVADPLLHSTQAQLALSSIPPSATFAWPCAACHGGNLTGLGIAPSCASCHAGSVTPPVVAGAPDALATGETCANCHDGQGAVHQATYNKYTDASALTATIVSVVSTVNATDSTKFDVTVTFDLKKNGVAFETDITKLAQKTVYVTKYVPATRQFTPSTSLAKLAPVAGTPGRYTAKNNLLAGTPAGSAPVMVAFAPESSNAMVYAYFAEGPTLIPPSGHYSLYDNLASVAQKFDADPATPWTWTSAANSADCERCHGAPYLKHGYRAGFVSGVPDMAPCKACHYDTRNGSHRDWQCLAESPAIYAAGTCDDTAAGGTVWASYAYKATTMNDTHMSHAMEFAYPQDMANCVTCHSGKLNMILTDALFTTATCKSCHPFTATHPDAKRAPPLQPAGAVGSALPAYHNVDRGTGLVGGRACNACHADSVCGYDAVAHAPVNCAVGDPAATDGVGPTFCFAYDTATPPACVASEYVPLFKEIHTGYNKVIYANNAGLKYSDVFKTAITAASYDSATKELTFTVTATESPDVAGLAVTDIVPTVLVSLYGYDTKDFIVGAHVSAADGLRNLEWDTSAVAGTCNCDTDGDHVAGDGCPGGSVPQNGAAADTVCATYPRMELVVPAAGGVWQVKAKLATAKQGSETGGSLIDAGAVKRVEIGVIPTLHNADHEILALDAVTRTFDLAANAFDDGFYAAIVDPAKCDKCHEALATTFHEADRGGSVVGCRLCHTTLSGGSHLPMQSRSIDSYVHAIHSMQPFDPADIDFSDPVEALHYEHHIESTYPNFTTLNCLSCHNSGMFNIPDQTKSLPGILSANDAGMPFVVPSVVTGPGSRACGGCHRAELINEGDTAGLTSFDVHTKAFGYRVNAASSSAATTALMNSIDALFCNAGIPLEVCVAPVVP